MMLHLNLTLFLIHRVSVIFLLLYIYLYFLNILIDIDIDSDSVCSSYGTLFFGLISRFIFLIFFMDPSIDSDDYLICDDGGWKKMGLILVNQNYYCFTQPSIHIGHLWRTTQLIFPLFYCASIVSTKIFICLYHHCHQGRK